MAEVLKFEEIPAHLAEKRNKLGQQWGQWKEWKGAQVRLPGDYTFEQSGVAMFRATYEIVVLNSLHRIAQARIGQQEVSAEEAEAIEREAIDGYSRFSAQADPSKNRAYLWGRSTKDFHALTYEEIFSEQKPGAVSGKNQASSELIANVGRVNPSLVRPDEYMSVFAPGLKGFVRGNLEWIGEEMGSSFTDVDKYALSVAVIQQESKTALREEVDEHMANFMRLEPYFEKTDLLMRSWDRRHGPIYARLGYLDALNDAMAELRGFQDAQGNLRHDILSSVFFSKFKGHFAKPLFKLMLYDLRLGDIEKADAELKFVAGLHPGIFPVWRARQIVGQDYEPEVVDRKNYGTAADGYITLRKGEFEKIVIDNLGKAFNRTSKPETQIVVTGLEKGKVVYTDSEGKSRKTDFAGFIKKYHLV